MVGRVFGAEGAVPCLDPFSGSALPSNQVRIRSTPCIALQPSLSPPGFPFSPAPCAAATLASIQLSHNGLEHVFLWGILSLPSSSQ